MVETKFKDTEIGRIPIDWEVLSLSNCANRVAVGLATTTTDFYRQRGVPMFRNLNIKENYLDDSDILYLDPKFANANSSKKLRYKDVLTVHTGYVGISCVVPEKYEGALTFTTLVTTLNEEVLLPEFMARFLNSDLGQFEVAKQQSSGARSNLNVADFVNVLFVVPSISEQEKISNTLRSVDNLISSLDKLIEKKKNIKQGTMQQLLTGKKRLNGFCEPWVEKQLGELLQYEQPTKYLVSSTEYSDNGIPVLTAGKTFILGYTNETHGIYNNLPVIIFDDFVTESKYVDFPFKAKSSAMKMLTLRDSENNLRFVYEIMQMIDFPMTDHKRWWIGEYSHIIVKIPSVDEQNAIASVLTTMDNEISALESKKAKYESLKQGMMQQLLTGKIRLV